MALHSREDFCTLCGITSRELSTYISRGHAVPSGNVFDDTIPQNDEFIKKRAEIIKKKKAKETESSSNTKAVKPPIKTHHLGSPNYTKIKQHQHTEPSTEDIEKIPLVELERRQKVLYIEKTAEEIEKLKLHNAKASGESIPSELVKGVVSVLAKSFITSFHNGAESLLITMSKKMDIDRVQLAEFKGELLKIINESIHKTVDDSKRQISNIVQEYAIQRGPGEKE